jgi:hypothetical protein
MHDLFELVFEYRQLLARRKAEGPDLASPVRHRLDALHRLLGREPILGHPEGSGTFSRRRHARCDVEAPARLRLGDELLAIELSNLGAGGVCAVTPVALEVGQRGALRLVSPDSGRTYECVAQVSWASVDDEQHLVGLRFVGAPREVPPAS